MIWTSIYVLYISYQGLYNHENPLNVFFIGYDRTLRDRRDSLSIKIPENIQNRTNILLVSMDDLR